MLLLLPLTLLVHLILLTNTRFTLWPEIVVYPYLLNNGFQLYSDLINPYPPLFTSFLSLFSKLFGYQPIPYQLLTWFLILLTDITIFQIVKINYKKNSYAMISIVFFASASLVFSINGLWFDLVQTPLILLSFFFLQKYLSRGKSKDLLITTHLLTIAFFIKQQVVWFGAFALIALYRKFRTKTPQILLKNAYIFLPFLIIFTLFLVYFSKTNILGDFLFWTFYFPFVKASQIHGYIQLPTLKQAFTILSLLAFFVPIIIKGSTKSKLTFWASSSLLLFAYPRFDYFHLIPAIALLSTTVGENIYLLKKINLPIRLVSTIGAIALIIFGARFLSHNWTQEVRFFEKDIFQTSIKIQELTKTGELVFIQNGPDQLLPLSQSLVPKPWVDDFPWYLEAGIIQDKVIAGLDNQKPKYIIAKPYDQGDKYAIGSYRPSKIANYISNHYQNTQQISDTLWIKERI